MPNGSTKKQNSAETAQRNASSSSDKSIISSAGGSRARKRKRCKIVKHSDSDFESELDDCNLEDAIAIERKLRKVAKENALSDDEMRKLLQKFVRNEHILALVTLKAEDEIVRERREAEQRAIIITDTPSVPKLTRARARELNKTPTITLPSLMENNQPEIAALIKDDLHSDEDDEEYVFKEEDFVSDDDPSTNVSDLDSNPRTPQTPLTQTEYEGSPVKLTADGCFKIPLDKQKDTQEDLRIAARTRSKLCLQQTTIEDIQSEFVPPDVEQVEVHEADMAATDEEWMQFLNDFSKPLNSNFVTDDDDPINDPEYVAAEKVREDAEELRDVNISKKELTELVAELFEGLMNEGVSLESVELDTPQKFANNNSDQMLNTLRSTPAGRVPNDDCTDRGLVTRQLEFDTPLHQEQQEARPFCVSDARITSSNITQNEYSFHPDVMSTPAAGAPGRASDSTTHVIPVANAPYGDATSKTVSVPVSSLSAEPELIAIPIPDQPNCYQLAKVVGTASALTQSVTLQSPEKLQAPQMAAAQSPHPAKDSRYSVPYDNNFTWEYISIKKHVYSEYIAKFERLRSIAQSPSTAAWETPQAADTGYTRHQHDILQQQLRIHVQTLTQTYLQTYCHPDFWKLAPKAKQMLCELQEKAADDASFKAWNLSGAVGLIKQWEEDLSQDTEENKEMMRFLHKEIEMTNRNTRQVPRFAPRLMDVMLNSTVFMYPQYLPRIPFTPKVCSFHIFSPAESQLIAIGLEKHLLRMRESGERLSKKSSPLVVACERLSKDTVFGKTKRRIWDHIKVLKNAKYYNPIKYFFEHDCAPPIEHNLLTFDNNAVLPLRERFSELPIAWQDHIKIQANPPTAAKKAATLNATASKQAGDSYLQFVREALGEDIQLPENLTEAAQPDASITDSSAVNIPSSVQRTHHHRRERFAPRSVTINVNYIFGAPNDATHQSNVSGAVSAFSPSTVSPNANCSIGAANGPHILPNSLPVLWPTDAPAIVFNYDHDTQTLQHISQSDVGETTLDHTQRSVRIHNEPPVGRKDASNTCTTPILTRTKGSQKKICKQLYSAYCRISRRNRHAARKHRNQRILQKRCVNLITLYRLQVQRNLVRYSKAPLVQRYYCRFKALELYSDLLVGLKMACRNAVNVVTNASTSAPSTTVSSPSNMGKRSRVAANLTQSLDEESNIGVRSKKANRQEENFRHMLLPDSAEDANRKDAIYAFNFYEKVEEVLKSSNRLDDCRRFNQILKSFNPKRDKVANLYYKLEQLFLPDHPELAQVFLTFLLPSEAAEIGKFFEHFMITNMSTFINKLNVYFNKQPAQIRKIYTCLNQLAEDPDVTIKKIETKILPLLKGNQFLIDWFLQQFPEEPPPERLLSASEHVNLKEVQNNQSGEFIESVTDLLDSPELPQHQQQQCQLRYINGRIFYGSKMTLPAKLSFMATHYRRKSDDCTEFDSVPHNSCIHSIREHGERRLAAAAAAAAATAASVDCNSDDNDKSDEENVSKALVIDTTGGEEDSNSSFETCDDTTLRAHAIRLNPSYYGTSCFNSVTSTPNPGSSHLSHHHPNAKKNALNFGEEGKVSPRKHTTSQSVGACAASANSAPLCNSSNLSSIIASSPANVAHAREKRKSPTKKSKSPIAAARTRPCLQPMVVIHEQHSAIACAKKLKSLIEEENESETDTKDRLTIVARVKHCADRNDSLGETASLESFSSQTMVVPKIEHTENFDEIEFLPEHTGAQPTLHALNMDMDGAEGSAGLRHVNVAQAPKHKQMQKPQPGYTITTHFDSDEDCKLDIVASLATSTNESLLATTSAKSPAACQPTTATSAALNAAQIAWTRDEDKIILIEMKLSSGDRDALFQRIRSKLPNRTLSEITERHRFLMDFLSKLQGK